MAKGIFRVFLKDLINPSRVGGIGILFEAANMMKGGAGQKCPTHVTFYTDGLRRHYDFNAEDRGVFSISELRQVVPT